MVIQKREKIRTKFGILFLMQDHLVHLSYLPPNFSSTYFFKSKITMLGKIENCGATFIEKGSQILILKALHAFKIYSQFRNIRNIF